MMSLFLIMIGWPIRQPPHTFATYAAIEEDNKFIEVEDISNSSEIVNTAMNDESLSDYDWLANMATTSHICNAQELFDNYTNIRNMPIVGIGNLNAHAEGQGCHRPRVSRSSHDQHALVSVETSQNGTHSFVLPSIVPCMISIGAASCSLAHSSFPCYCCPVSCSLYYIGIMCGGPCSSLDY